MLYQNLFVSGTCCLTIVLSTPGEQGFWYTRCCASCLGCTAVSMGLGGNGSSCLKEPFITFWWSFGIPAAGDNLRMEFLLYSHLNSCNFSGNFPLFTLLKCTFLMISSRGFLSSFFSRTDLLCTQVSVDIITHLSLICLPIALTRVHCHYNSVGFVGFSQEGMRGCRSEICLVKKCHFCSLLTAEYVKE